ncbi:MAG TPA: hypothetical protein VHB79_20155 [Polyangiaceae bacterium]|nr:hypothetical protein [Polyangiaceae bacterium]
MKRHFGRLAALLGVFGSALVLGAVAPAHAASSGAANAPAVTLAATPPGPPRDAYEGPPLLLAKGQKHKLGGYGGFGGGYTRLIGRDSGLVSLEGAMLFDHRFSIGLVGYGFTRLPSGPAASDGTAQQFSAGYGGLALRYSVFGNLPVYGTFGLVLGGGAVNLHPKYDWSDDSNWNDDFDNRRDDRAGRFDSFLFAQPEIALNANATRWLRLGATLGYRFTGGIGRFGLSESDVNGIVAGGNIQLGWF